MVKDYRNVISSETASLLLNIEAMTFRFDSPYVYTSGMKSPVYLDCRLVMSYPKVRTRIANFYERVIKKEIGLKNIDWISGTATAAITYATWVAEKLNLPMVYVRPTSKKYGKGGKVEGFLKKGGKVLIIEDLVTTASSAINNALTIRELGSKVKYAVAVITYETKTSKDLLEKNKIKLLPLTTARNVIEIAFKKGYLNRKQKESVDLWMDNPWGWAKKMGFEK